jgi:hypothetical protein
LKEVYDTWCSDSTKKLSSTDVDAMLILVGYNFQQAHMPKDLPVSIVNHYTAQRIKISIASTQERDDIN